MKTIELSIEGHPELTRDLTYQVGRALSRMTKRIKTVDAGATVMLDCPDTEAVFSLTAGEMLNGEGFQQVLNWLIEQSDRVQFAVPTGKLLDLFARLAAVDATSIPHLYLDMDGFCADFDLGYSLAFGHHPLSITQDEMWQHIDSEPLFYSKLPEVAHAKAFYDSVKHIPHTFLTVARNMAIINGKSAWLFNHMAPGTIMMPVWKKPKANFAAPGFVLLDDHEENVNPWNEKGGIGILHVDYETTATNLYQAITTHLKETT